MKDSHIHPPDVPTNSTSPQTLRGCHSHRLQRGLQHLESPTRGFRRVLGHQLSPRLEPVSVRHSLHQSQASSSGQCRQQSVQCVTQRSDGHCRFFCSCWKVPHCLRLCVLQRRHVLLIHQSEVVLELEAELEPGLLVVVVLDKFRSKLQDFCAVRRRHITAPLPCASVACSVTRSTTNGDQQNDFVMWTPA